MVRRQLRFRPVRPASWQGRYARIPGETTVFHLRYTTDGWWPVVDWTRGDDTGHCWMVDSDDVPALVAGVLAGKRALGVAPGGAFLVNEFGQVLVPASDAEGTSVVLVGECSGPLMFENPFDSARPIDIGGGGLRPGEPWDRPYIGVPHNLNHRNEICFKDVGPYGHDWLQPPTQDVELIDALRALRPSGFIRFIVTVGGLVVTKVEPHWEPRFVGQINHSRWFAKEV